VNGLWLDQETHDDEPQAVASTQMMAILEDVLTSSADPVIVRLRQQIEAILADDTQIKEQLKARIATIEAINSREELISVIEQLHHDGYSPLFRLASDSDDGIINGLITNGNTLLTLKNLFISKDTERIKVNVEFLCKKLKAIGYDDQRIEEITDHATQIELLECDAFEYSLNMLKLPTTTSRKKYSARTRGDSHDSEIAKILNASDAFDKNLVFPFNEAAEKLMDLPWNEEVNVVRDYLIYNVFIQDLPFVPSVSELTDPVAILEFAIEGMNYLLNRLIVEAIKTEIQKQACLDVLEQIRELLIHRISSLDWMSDATKQRALEKARKMQFYIGYPDEWNSDLDIQLTTDHLEESLIKMRTYKNDLVRQLIGCNWRDKGWDYLTSTYSPIGVNAFFGVDVNALMILPAYLLPPLFDTSLSDADLYAAAFVFAHEMCHGFDSIGSLYNEYGQKEDWWTPADKEAFNAKQQEMIALYNQLEAYPGQPTDGEKTLHENMADYGGLTLAYELYKNKCKRQRFKGDDLDRQLRKFMVAYAYYWRYYYSEADLETWYRIDNHAVCPNRVNGTLRLLDDWYRLYDVQSGDKLYLAPEKRVKIW
jgi:predicted metalloendopeptidase